jgi:hypothetical protein
MGPRGQRRIRRDIFVEKRLKKYFSSVRSKIIREMNQRWPEARVCDPQRVESEKPPAISQALNGYGCAAAHRAETFNAQHSTFNIEGTAATVSIRPYGERRR